MIVDFAKPPAMVQQDGGVVRRTINGAPIRTRTWMTFKGCCTWDNVYTHMYRIFLQPGTMHGHGVLAVQVAVALRRWMGVSGRN